MAITKDGGSGCAELGDTDEFTVCSEFELDDDFGEGRQRDSVGAGIDR